MPSPRNRSSPRSPRRRARIIATTCSSCWGRTGASIRRKISEPWNHGESPERYPINTGRLRKVIETATTRGGLGPQAARQGRGSGLRRTTASSATSRRWSRSASTPKGELTIPRVDIAVDCGPHVNPDRVRSQIEGACVMGLSQAVVSEITFKNGPRAAGQLPPVRGRAHEHGSEARSSCTSSRRIRMTCRSAASASPACR